jgi:hypothetical protein
MKALERKVFCLRGLVFKIFGTTIFSFYLGVCFCFHFCSVAHVQFLGNEMRGGKKKEGGGGGGGCGFACARHTFLAYFLII